MPQLQQLIESAVLYANHGVQPGAFTRAVLSNDLFEAVMRADEQSYIHMRDLVRFILERLPRASWGSPELVISWQRMGGLVGLNLPLLPAASWDLLLYSLSGEVRGLYEQMTPEAQATFRRSMGADAKLSKKEGE